MRIASRHIVSIGRRSLAVVLPKAWVSMLGLRSGDRVVLRLNEDGSITIVPHGSRIYASLGLLPRLGRWVYVADERLAAKERLMEAALGVSAMIRSDPGLSSSLSSLQRSGSIDHEDLVDSMLRYLEDACSYVVEYASRLDSNTAKKIHEIEGKADLLYYLSYRSGALDLLESVERELGVGRAMKTLLNISLLKISEDLVDSFDRIAWRIEESGAPPSWLSQTMGDVGSLLQGILVCFRSSCDEEEIDRRYEEIQRIRRILREEISRSERSSQVYAEVLSILNNLEGLIEISLMKTLIDGASRLDR